MVYEKTWVLTDVAKRLAVAEWSFSSKEISLDLPWHIKIDKRRLSGGLCDGVEVIDVDNGAFSFTVVPTRGMGLWEGSYRGWRLGWRSPVRGPVHPAHVRPMDLGGLGWLNGFDEWVVRCGLSYHGAPGFDRFTDACGNSREMYLPLHGQIANQPAHYVEVRVQFEPPHRIEIRGVIEESCLFHPQLRLATVIATTPGSPAVSITDEVTNLRSQPAEFELLYHCNFGRPLLGPGARLVAPLRMFAPRDQTAAQAIDEMRVYPGPRPGIAEQVYFAQLHAQAQTGNTLVMLVDPTGEKACAVRFSTHELPWFTLWKNPGADSDGYVTGLEPGTDLPNHRSFERAQKRVKILEPNASWIGAITLEAADTAQEVSRLEQEVRELEESGTTIVHRKPVATLSPA